MAGWRETLAYDDPQPRTTRGMCSAPGCLKTGGDGYLTITKHHHATQPKGHLYNRCPEHQARYERRLAA